MKVSPILITLMAVLGMQSVQGATIAEKLRAIIIPSIELSEAPLSDAVDFLQSKSGELDALERVGINIILDASDEAAMKPVSLNLHNVTLGRALWFLAEIAGMDLKVDHHAVMLREREGRTAKKRVSEPNPAVVNKLRTIVIPSLEFNQTPFDDALQFLRDVSVRDDPDPDVARRGVNIVRIPPQSGESVGAVTIRLNNVPLSQAIGYVCELVDHEVSIEKGAVVVSPEVPKSGKQ